MSKNKTLKGVEQWEYIIKRFDMEPYEAYLTMKKYNQEGLKEIEKLVGLEPTKKKGE